MPYAFAFNGKYYNITESDAARFLHHATLGCTDAEIQELHNSTKNRFGYWSWLNTQIASRDPVPVPPVRGASIEYMFKEPGRNHFDWLQLAYRLDDNTLLQANVQNNFGKSDTDQKFSNNLFISSFIRKLTTTKEKLRLKTAYALSQILVISGVSGLDDEYVSLKMAGYFDLLHENCFGYFEDLLYKISTNVVMAEFLTFLGSEKANATTGNVPDENFAREVLQLFTIGPDALDPSTGEPIYYSTDASGTPIARESYDGQTVATLAKLFTGWKLNPSIETSVDRFKYDAQGIVNDFSLHDNSTLKLIFKQYSKSATGEQTPSTITIDSDVSAEARLKSFCRQIIRHPNTKFNIAKLLIQRLVTSNPSQGYIQRVAKAFDTDYVDPIEGITKKGYMPGVISAILLDDALFSAPSTITQFVDSAGVGHPTQERSAIDAPLLEFGRVREPFVRLCNVLTATIYSPSQLGQSPLCAPSVFNFYRPGYVSPNSTFCAQKRTVAINGINYTPKLVSPELQITNGLTMTAYADYIAAVIDPDRCIGGFKNIKPNYTDLISLAGTASPIALLDKLGLLLCGGLFSGATRTSVETVLSTLPFATTDQRSLRVQIATYLIAISPDYIFQQ